MHVVSSWIGMTTHRSWTWMAMRRPTPATANHPPARRHRSVARESTHPFQHRRVPGRGRHRQNHAGTAWHGQADLRQRGAWKELTDDLTLDPIGFHTGDGCDGRAR
eukprot:scaffold73_cov337-Pavlova_lutheri.AAC.74